MRKILVIRILVTVISLAFALSNQAFGQNRKRHKRTIADSLRATMMRRDSMMRHYKTSDTSTNNLLQRIEYYTLSFNQISNLQSKRLDTADISAALPRLEKLIVTMRGLILKDRAGTLRYLYAIRDVLSKQQDKLDVWQDRLMDISDKLADIDDDINQISKDSIFRIFPTDSTLRITFLDQRSAIEARAQKLDKVNSKAILKLGLLQNRLTSVYISIIDQKELIDNKIRSFSMNSLNCEYGYIWNMQSDRDTTFSSALSRTVSMNLKLFKLLNDQVVKHLMGLLLLCSFLVWIIVNRRKILKKRNNFKEVFAQTGYIVSYPYTSALLVTSLVVPYLYSHPPVVFLQIVFMVSTLCILRIVYKTFPRPQFNFLLKLFVLGLLFSISNLFIEVSNIDRVTFLIITAATAWICFAYMRKIGSVYEPHLPFAKTILGLVIFFESGALLLNVAGRFSLAKIIGVTALYNFWLALCLYYFIQILVQSLFLQLETYKDDDDSISSYLDFKLLQSRFKSLLYILAMVMWVVTLLQNLSVEDSVFDILGAFLTQSRNLGGTLFTFGSIIIFIGVIWISTILARIIAYFYDFADQKRNSTTIGRKTKTSLLLVRIAVFSVGFLLAVAASGFPLDKVTIIISALGVGVGFGLQNIVNNLVSGLILAFEKPIQVGDVIEVANRTGTIKDIGMRSSKIATGNGAEIIIPNGDLISQHVINWTLSDSNRQVELLISVAFGCDVDKVKNILRNLVSNRDDIMVNPAPVIFLDKLGSGSIDFKLLFWAADISEWEQLKSQVLTTIYKEFEKEGIKMPKPAQQIVVSMPPSEATPTHPTSPANENLPGSGQ
ncbi:mechanosensitive ion channel family protein [Mucilaginibacter terrae]|uniref:Potassium efflux system protein n=1 Tax=Mucilaginibacter terrae TaxID=1955052 RepID=A0ABU3GP62_9SPHI|nr:mechanosensitive ion channel domain-containing protein [Mucilaginibacter terrae]MDT3401566.1 potassium efflux system protein [Mucilaginibacter terrae]